MEIHGHVATFDADRGDGLLRTIEGASFYFHCVDIADGTRLIVVGERVSALRAVGHRGHDEAVRVVKLPQD